MLLKSIKKIKSILFIGILLSLEPLYGQFYEITRYADDNGLPSRIVRGVDQDPNGFLWVAGNNGLYKFDGQQFHGYYAILNDTTGLRDNKINAVLAARDSTIWIATPKGLHRLKNEEIEYVSLGPNLSIASNHITDLFEDSDQNIWVSSYKGFYVIEKETGNIIDFLNYNPNPTKDYPIWEITEDQKGRIWVCQGRKLPLISDKNSYNFKEMPLVFETSLDTQTLNPFGYVEIDNQHVLLTTGSGLYRGTITDNNQLRVRPFYDANGRRIADEFLYHTLIDNEQNIWTATWKNRFKKYQLKDTILIEQEVISKNGWENMAGHARSVFQDSQNNIWIPNANGLYKLSEANIKMDIFPPSYDSTCFEKSFSVYAIAEDEGEHLWINTSTHLYRIRKEDILANKCPTDYLKFNNKHFLRARNILIDSENRLWISGIHGISVSQLNKKYEPGPFKHFTKETGLPHTWSNEILQENKNTFWIGNYSRLVRFKLLENDINHPSIISYDQDRNREDALVNSYTIQLAKDSNNDLWIGTFSGVSRLISPEGAGIFKSYVSQFGESQQLSNNSIKNIFKDYNGRLWIGTQTGLNLYQPESDSFLQFGRKDGLPSEYILGIAEDSKQNLWIATTSGLFKGVYNESMQRFVDIEYYTKKEGLADNITNLNAIYIDKNDRVFIGSSAGLSISNNNEIIQETSPFNVALTAIESVQKKKQGLISIRNRIVDNEINLLHNENSIQLKYTALDFTNPGHNQYRHKILPVSTDWINTGENAQLNYYNLAIGTYDLILDGSNNQGIWSENPIHLRITIHPPFWKSNWAIGAYILLFAGVIRLFYLFRIRKRVRELEQETRLEKALLREREQLRNENAADFHDELGSKVTKISMFLTLAERTLKEEKDPSSWFKKIRENITDLSGSFRDLLWVIDPQKDSLSDAFLRLKDFGEDLFNNTNVHYCTHGYSEKLEKNILDPQTKKQIVLIFKEAMNNCAKYADSTIVELTVETSEGYASICLKDNGKGFNVHRQSKGRGLTNMKNRSEKIGSNLSIVSGENGTIITLYQIPHLGDEVQDK